MQQIQTIYFEVNKAQKNNSAVSQATLKQPTFWFGLHSIILYGIFCIDSLTLVKSEIPQNKNSTLPYESL